MHLLVVYTILQHGLDVTQLHLHLHLLDCCQDHECQYGWLVCRAASLDAPGDAKRSRRIRTVDYSKPGGEAPFSVPAMSGMAGRSASSGLTRLVPFLLVAFPACCLLPFLPVASCLSCQLLPAFPACCWLPFLPVAHCLSCLLLVAFPACSSLLFLPVAFCLPGLLLLAFHACCFPPSLPVYLQFLCAPLLYAVLPIAACFMPTVRCLSTAACLQLGILPSVSMLLSLAEGCKAEQSVIHLLLTLACLCFVLPGMLQTSMLQC